MSFNIQYFFTDLGRLMKALSLGENRDEGSVHDHSHEAHNEDMRVVQRDEEGLELSRDEPRASNNSWDTVITEPLE